MQILLGLVAVLAILGISYALSERKDKINWKTIAGGLIGQVVLIFFVLKVPIGQKILSVIANGFQAVINFGMEGVQFVFGDLSTSYFTFAINVLALIVFTSTLIAVLYFFKIIPVFIKYVGGFIAKVMNVSKIDGIMGVSNSLLGGGEAPLTIKPFLPTITKSELFVTMATGFGSASVGILGGYMALGIPAEPMLIGIFTVPFSCIMIAKMLIPETEKIENKEIKITGEEYENIFDAISAGSATGFKIACGVGASLIGFIGIIAILNGILGIFGLSLAQILGYIFLPFTWLFNIPAGDLSTASAIFGTKLGVNEFVAFSNMSQAMSTLSPRTITLLAVGCVNFSNFSVIGIVCGSLITLIPERRKEITSLGFKALITGTLSTLLTTALVAIIL